MADKVKEPDGKPDSSTDTDGKPDSSTDKGEPRIPKARLDEALGKVRDLESQVAELSIFKEILETEPAAPAAPAPDKPKEEELSLEEKVEQLGKAQGALTRNIQVLQHLTYDGITGGQAKVIAGKHPNINEDALKAEATRLGTTPEALIGGFEKVFGELPKEEETVHVEGGPGGGDKVEFPSDAEMAKMSEEDVDALMEKDFDEKNPQE